MTDYNKGDFTQQGIDGFVEGGLHLNEKRCLTAKISTDEDSAGLDSVEINIHDHLNDLDYTITGENLVVGENTIGGGGGGSSTIILPMTEVTWDGTGDGGHLLIDPDTSKVSDNEQVIIRLNYLDEGTSEFILFGTYAATAGPTMEDFSGITEGDPAVSIAIRHVTDRPNEPWFLVVSVGDEAMGGTYQVGICKDIPHEAA